LKRILKNLLAVDLVLNDLYENKKINKQILKGTVSQQIWRDEGKGL
jgi:hypothetical protein